MKRRLTKKKREKIKEARRRLLKGVLKKSDEYIELKEIKELLEKIEPRVNLNIPKSAKEVKLFKTSDKVEVLNPDEFPRPPNKIEVKNFPDPVDKVSVKNLDDLKLPTPQVIVNKEQVKVETKNIKFPRRQKVHIANFPNQIANETKIIRDDRRRIQEIREVFDKFTLVTTFVYGENTRTITTEKI